MDKVREEFEEWFSTSQPAYDGAAYRSVKETAFQAWKASRAALVVELPHCDNESHDYYRSCVEVELDNAGIRYE